MRHRLTALLVLLLSACSAPRAEDDPIASLSSAERSATFTAEYWSAQAAEGTQLWQRALTLCDGDAQTLSPNCRAVRQAQFIDALKAAARRISKPYDGATGPAVPEALSEVLEPRGLTSGQNGE